MPNMKVRVSIELYLPQEYKLPSSSDWVNVLSRLYTVDLWKKGMCQVRIKIFGMINLL